MSDHPAFMPVSKALLQPLTTRLATSRRAKTNHDNGSLSKQTYGSRHWAEPRSADLPRERAARIWEVDRFRARSRLEATSNRQCEPAPLTVSEGGVDSTNKPNRPDVNPNLAKRAMATEPSEPVGNPVRCKGVKDLAVEAESQGKHFSTPATPARLATPAPPLGALGALANPHSCPKRTAVQTQMLNTASQQRLESDMAWK